jgi:hypothetical protein
MHGATVKIIPNQVLVLEDSVEKITIFPCIFMEVLYLPSLRKLTYIWSRPRHFAFP